MSSRSAVLVVHIGPLEVEEEELRVDLRVPLAHLLDERAARLVGAVGRQAQAGEDLDARTRRDLIRSSSATASFSSAAESSPSLPR